MINNNRNYDNNREARLLPGEQESARNVQAVFVPPHYPLPGRVAREPHLRDYLIILRKHQWLILSVLLAVVTIVTIASFKMQAVYVAAARVEIDRENSYILPFRDVMPQESYVDMDNYIETRAKILQSETLALATIKSLDLEKHPEFVPAPEKGRVRASQIPGGADSQEKPMVLDDFLDRLGVRRIRNSRLLEVQFEAHDPKLAAKVVNSHLVNFVEHNFQTRYDSTVQASNWLATQLDELKITVEKSEDSVVAYERENQIWAIDEKQNITTQKLSDLNRELTVAQADRMRKEADYSLARSGKMDAIPAVRDSQVIQSLLEKRAQLNNQYAEALAQFGPKYPKVLRLEAQLKEHARSLQQEKLNIVGRIESEYRAARQREALLSQALESQKTKTNLLAQKLVQYNILKREAETNKQLHEGLLQRIKEAGVSAGLRSSNIRVVDPALVPSEPARPRKALNILLASFVGLLGGVGLAFFREYLDNTVKTPEDVEYLTQLPSLAMVPALAGLNGHSRNGRAPQLPKSQSLEVKEPRVELISHERPRSPVSESFRALRTSLLLSQAERPPQVILVTSALPLEGKTTAAANLAITLAQLGDRTLLVDADLRKPGIAKALNLGEGKRTGLSSYLAGASSIEEVVVDHPRVRNLAAIPAGPIPPNPAELLSAPRMQEAIASLRQAFKFIVVDSPPLLSATDAAILSVLADSALLVVRSGETPKEAVTRARDLLVGVRCRLLGVVLNAVDFTSPYYYSYRYYPYAYGAAKDAPW